MENNLTLPILCSYLPWKVRIYDTVFAKSRQMNPEDLTRFIVVDGFDESIKLLLRPMSDLDKPLEELGGKSMMNWLNDLIVHTFEVEGKETVTEEFLELMKEYGWMLPEKARTKLLSLHFDIFGLLESGNALNLNEILNETKG